MKLGRLLLTSALIGTIAAPCVALTHSHRGPTSHKLFNKRSKSGSKAIGQRAIDESRATEIQTALIKAGYLSGEATGRWDAETQSAMQKYQGDNGWQTKLTPDSRAIIKLGLGPAQDAELGSGGTSTMSVPAPSTSAYSQ